MTAKEEIKALIEAQPDDATFEDILRELALSRMVDRGLADAREGRILSNEEMGQRVRQWRRQDGPRRRLAGSRTPPPAP